MAEEIEESSRENKKTERKLYTKHANNIKDLVNFNNIQKEIISREKKTQLTWPTKYGYLSGESFHKVPTKFSCKVMAEKCKKVNISMDTFKQKFSKDSTNYSPILLKPSPAIPKTSSAIIGWRSARPEYNLEFTGRMYISPKWTIEPYTKFEERYSTQQHFIFLG